MVPSEFSIKTFIRSTFASSSLSRNHLSWIGI